MKKSSAAWRTHWVYDALTGTMNRNSYHAKIKTLTSGKYRLSVCVYIDANGLHKINNHLGRQAEDEMLKALAQALGRLFSQDEKIR